VQLLEVIRIIGPFPNIKNALQESSAMAKTKTTSGDDFDGFEAIAWTVS
jgi:hypothetical protein